MPRPRFTIRELIFVTVIIALATALALDSRRSIKLVVDREHQRMLAELWRSRAEAAESLARSQSDQAAKLEAELALERKVVASYRTGGAPPSAAQP